MEPFRGTYCLCFLDGSVEGIGEIDGFSPLLSTRGNTDLEFVTSVPSAINEVVG